MTEPVEQDRRQPSRVLGARERDRGQLPAAGLRAVVEDNLETLGVGCLDLVYLRIGKMEVPHGESVAERFEALATLREQGLIRHLGLSNISRGIAFAPFFPLGGGGADINDRRLANVAARHGATPPQIALAWLRALSPMTLAIPGTGSLAHLEENMAAGSIALTDEDLAELSV